MELEIGQEVDGYLIQGIIGRGGMGIVYKAEDIALSRQVALKVINPSMSRDEAFVRRFQSEARTLAVINSPHIVAIHALRKTEQGLFIVMEFVDGGDLSDRMQKGILSVGQTISIISQLLRALQVAHTAGVVHRDIKPPNIMISNSGEVKVTDFGLAKMNQAGLTKSMTQGVIGTLYYMSPEQIRGEEVDHRSDLWSLGVVFFEMLTGARPFDGPQEASVMYSILNEPAVFSEKHQNELPKEIQRIIGRALEKDREKRYSDATEMLVELESFESSSVNMTETRVMPGRARESGTTSRSRSSSSKTGQARTSSGESQGAGKRRVLSVENKKPFIIAAGGALIVVVGLLAYFMFFGSDDVPPPTISLNSEPDKASVYVDGDFIGKTPIADFEVEGGNESIPVRIEFGGYVSLDTILTARMMHFVELRADESSVATSNDNRNTTASTRDTPPAQTSNDVPQQQEPRPIAPGSVILRAFPNGESFVDGESVPSEKSYSLSVGRHTIRFVSSVYGSAETVVRIKSRETRTVNVYFESDITISTRPSSIVFIDNNLVGETPYVDKLGPGSYRIHVEKDGYVSSPVDTTIMVEPTFDRTKKIRLSFTLQKE